MNEIGTIEIAHFPPATLMSDGLWQCEDSGLRAMLNAKWRVRRHGPEDGEYGWGQLHGAAIDLGGRVVKITPVEHVEGRVY